MFSKKGIKFWSALALIVVWSSALCAQDEPPVEDPVIEATILEPEVDDEMEGMGEGIYLNAPSADIRALLQQISQSERINIVAAGDVEGNVSVNLYGATVDQALEAILSPQGYGYVRKGNFIYVMKTDELNAFGVKQGRLETEIYVLNYLSIDDAKELLTLYLSEDGEMKFCKASDAGIPTGDTETGGESNASNNLIVVKDFPDVHRNLAEALKVLDAPPRQVLVEATIVEVTLDDTNRLGVNFTALGGVDFSNLDDSSSNLLSVTAGDAAAGRIDRGFNVLGTRGFTSPEHDQGFSFGILKSDLAVFLDALESVTDTNVLANPKILALNRQRAEFINGGRLGYFGSETLSDGGFSQQEVEFLDVGTQLRFRAFIGADDFIRMEIHPERSDGVVDSVTGLPSETTSEVTTNILVKNGDTVVIGGMIEERDTSTVAQVPLLGSIPIIGWLFKKEETSTRRVEIIILITPKIIDPYSQDDEAEEMLVGYKERKKAFRHGFKFYTRTVRAECHRDRARHAIEDGKYRQAGFHLGWALSLDPNVAEAQELKAQLEALEAESEPQEDTLEEYIWSSEIK